MDTNEEFKVDLDKIHLNRVYGISGVMRVKNDAEFIVASVESCIEALDELVIVYNGCTDRTPELAEQLRAKYPEKIKVYNYKPNVISGNLTEEQYLRARQLPSDSVELLANYYNYALAKTSRTHVMKIDADQVYFTETLKALCDRIRHPKLKALSPLHLYSFLKVATKIQHFTWHPGDSSDTDFRRYREALEFFCSKGLLSVALSGLNVFIKDNNHYVPQGLKTYKLNILPQFNGSNDHPIFKVKKGTRFVPYDDKSYGAFVSAKYTFIEKLTGTPRSFSWGFIWWHLNGMRVNIYAGQSENFLKYPHVFMPLRDFLALSPEQVSQAFNHDFVTAPLRTNYTFYWTHCRHEISPDTITKYSFPHTQS